MTDVGDLLGLLHGASNRWRTARGEVRYWFHLRRHEQARRRVSDRQRKAGASTGSYVAYPPPTGPLPEFHEWRTRFWIEPPDRLREERVEVAPHERTSITVKNGPRWWSFAAEDVGVVTNVRPDGTVEESFHTGGGDELMQLLDPASWIPHFDFHGPRPTEWAGRAALAVQAVPRLVGSPHSRHPALIVGAERYDLVVDSERGVLLRTEAVLDDDPVVVVELTEIAFDETFPPETFQFDAPADRVVPMPAERRHRHLSVREAARRASFPVFLIPELPAGRWSTEAFYMEASERPPMEEIVAVSYFRADGTEQFMLTQRPAGSSAEAEYYSSDVFDVREVERGGQVFVVASPREHGHGVQDLVTTTRGATTLMLQSANVPAEVLLDLAVSVTEVTPDS